MAAPDESTSDLGIAAARRALAEAGASPDELDLIICSTISPDHPNPATACAIQAGLGAGQCPAYDLTAACSGFLYALDAGARQILTGARKVLVVSADVQSLREAARAQVSDYLPKPFVAAELLKLVDEWGHLVSPPSA